MLECEAQKKADKTDFQIFGHISGRDTGSVVLWYMNGAKEYLSDTTSLDHGQFTFSGNVGSACQGMIWTNQQNHDFDDQSVIRCIIEPGIMHIYKMDGVRKTTSTGSHAQNEKEKWDSFISSLTEADAQRMATSASLRKLERQAGQSLFTDRIDSLHRQCDSIRAIRAKLDLGYVAQHPESYLSGYLLWFNRRRIPIDSVKLLYTAFADSVKNSSVGYEVLKYVYPLTDDQGFRNKNPLMGEGFTKRLASIRSIHDLSLRDMSGKLVDLNKFKGKYLLVHVWTSWCKGCVADMPMWNSLLKQYDPNIIQFISVSLDRNVETWKQAVGKYHPKGPQLIDSSAFTGLFAIFCKVLWVGKYLIADPEGHILNYNADEPDEPAWRRLLDGYIKKEPRKDPLINVLIVDGFSNHDWKQTSLMVKNILERTGRFHVTVSTAPGTANDPGWTTWNPEFEKFAVVIQNTNNIQDSALQWPASIQQRLEKYVSSGRGLYVLHSANNAFPRWKEYNKMIGLGWRPKDTGFALQVDSNDHIVRIPPGQGEATNHGARFDAVIRILNRHPINEGYPEKWKTASMELYRYARGPAENLTILSVAADSVTGKIWPVEWVVKYGKGNVYVSSMVHLWKGDIYPVSYRCIGFQTTLIRATEWLATGKVTYPVPADFPSEEASRLRSGSDYPGDSSPD
ncbi:ThuA domain-containing protein [Flavitalea sp. BT771]|nr:ThuA domain-containing protein [Flavitalea sp. BT771]MDO6429058.1 ThuA domain-containing protein [Flavitalea sp. BT771]